MTAAARSELWTLIELRTLRTLADRVNRGLLSAAAR
jgi:hypothetical protein